MFISVFKDDFLFLLNFRIKNGNYLKQASPKAANIHNRW